MITKNKKICCLACSALLAVVPLSLGNTSLAAENLDLTGRTYRFDDTLSFGETLGFSDSEIFAVDFTYIVDGVTYNASELSFYTDYFANGGSQLLYTVSFEPLLVYNGDGVESPNGWLSSEYQTITFTGGADVTNQRLIELLSSFAVEEVNEPMGLFQQFFSFYSDTLFGGSASIDGSDYISLITLLLTTISVISMVIIPFAVVFFVIRFIVR